MTEACPELAPLLAARPLGVLEDAEVAKLDAHTKECERCAAFAKELESALAAAKPEARPAPAAAWDKIAQRIEEDRAERLATDDVTSEGSPPVRVSLNCTFCHEGLSSREAIYCASCLAPHHGECFEEHGRCSALGCGETRTVAPRTAPPKRPRRVARLLWIGLGTAIAGAAAVAAVRLYDLKEHNAALSELVAHDKEKQGQLAAENAELKTQIALLRARAALAASQKNYAESLGLLTRAIELDPRVASTWNERGVIKAEAGDRPGAIDDAVKAIELDPGLASAWMLRGRARLALGAAAAASGDFTRAIELAPRVAESWGSRGEAKSSGGDFVGARADFVTALKLTSDGAYRAKLLALEHAISPSSGPPVRVLYIEKWPRRDFHFITHSLMKDPDVIFQAWLMSAENGYEQEHSSNEGRDQDTLDRYFDFFAPLRAMPRDAADFSRYDVVVLGDVDVHDGLTPRFAEGLAAFALEHQGGLVFLAGEKDYLRSLRGTPLEELLPIRPVASVPANGTFTEALGIGLTEAGVASPITHLKEDATKNAKLWDGGLDGPYWVASVAAVRTDSTVLVATAIDNRPLFVTRQVFGAHVFVSLTDETWRWRSAGAELQETFWKNVFTWARRVEPPRAGTGYLGIQLVDNDGVLRVVQVFPDSPAARFLAPGDVILSLDGVAFTGLEPFRDALEKRGPGTTIVLVAERRSTIKLEFDVTLGEQPKAR